MLLPVVLSDSESNGTLWWCGWSDQLVEGVEDLLQLLVVLTHPLFDLLQSFLERGVRAGDAPQLNEGAHDLDVDGDGRLTPQDGGEHGDSLLGEDVGGIPATTPTCV